MFQIVDRCPPREYSLMSHGGGIVLCDKNDGALLCFRYAEDVEKLRELLATIDIVRLPPASAERCDFTCRVLMDGPTLRCKLHLGHAGKCEPIE